MTEDRRSELPSSDDPIPIGEAYPQRSLMDRATNRAITLPWWVIILVVFVVCVLYAMVTSATYRHIIQFVSDDPEKHTDDLFDVVQIVSKPTMMVGTYTGETQDSMETVVYQLLSDVIDTPLVTRTGFIEAETDATITIRAANGTITIPKNQIHAIERRISLCVHSCLKVTISQDQIRDIQPLDESVDSDVTISYTDHVSVTGTLVERNDDTMTIRTVDPVDETFATSRIMGEPEILPCYGVPNCGEGDFVYIQRQGEILTGSLTQSNQTDVTLHLDSGENREIRRSNIDYYWVPTLTIAVNEDIAKATVEPGETVRLGYIEGTDIQSALDEMASLEQIPIALNYEDGEIQVTLVAFPNVDSAMQATASGNIQGVVYLASQDDRFAVKDWVDANEDAGVVLPIRPKECTRHCRVTVKLVDDEVVGRVTARSADEITIRTVEAEFMVINRSDIIEDRKMKPGECALNNLRGCDAGIFLTLKVTFLAYGIALLIGLFVGLLRVSHNPVLYVVSTLYVEVIRGIPLLVILLYAGFVVSPWIRDHTPLDLSDTSEAVIGLAFGYGAFLAEVFRAGIQSISKGQMEAARSLGMSYPQAMRHVILPQAVRVILPPLGNDFISMLKDSALISVLALPDLLQLGRLYISRTFRAFEGYNTVAILYLVMTLFLSMMVRIIERRSRLPR
jgi:polar amino acid transport system permease protein